MIETETADQWSGSRFLNFFVLRSIEREGLLRIYDTVDFELFHEYRSRLVSDSESIAASIAFLMETRGKIGFDGANSIRENALVLPEKSYPL